MEFNQTVHTKLGPIFKKYNLSILKEVNNSIMFGSKKIVVQISHDYRDNTNDLSVGKDEKSLNTITEYILRSTFNSDLKIKYLPVETFINHISIFFESEGNQLLLGNSKAIQDIEKKSHEQDKKYTQHLLDRQDLNAADTAWNENNYSDFIKCLDKIGRNRLLPSYELKYKIAQKKLRE